MPALAFRDWITLSIWSSREITTMTEVPGQLIVPGGVQPFPTFSEIYVQARDDLWGPAGGCLTAAQTRAEAR